MQVSRNQREIGDKTIAFAVMIQSLLLVLQIVMINVLHMNGESTTVYRVLLTAVPMVLAMCVSAKRAPSRFVLTFLIAIGLLLYTIVFFPKNQSYVIGQGLRFLLPVVIPSFLCLTTVYDFQIVERTLYSISWFTAFLVIIYLLEFFRGVFTIDSYNMPFSYACLLPMVSLYSHRKVYDYVVVLILLFAVLAVGARGPAIYFLVYVVLDLFQKKSKWRFGVLILLGLIIIVLPSLFSFFSSLGLSSRTLRLLINGEFMQSSGRDAIQAYWGKQLMSHPVFGIGLFGDRLLEGTAYCHNLFLEILLNYGIVIGFFIIAIAVIKLVSLYINSNVNDRNRILRYFCALCLPFMTSSSYLIDSELAIFMGLCVLIHKENTNKRHVFASRENH